MAGGAHHRLLSSTTPSNTYTFVASFLPCLPTLPSYLPSCLPLFFTSYLRITSLLPVFLPCYPSDNHFHSPTESPTAPSSQPSNHQVTVEGVTSLYSSHMERGAFTMTLKEPCHGSEIFLNNSFKLVKYFTLLTILSDHVD